MVINDSTISVDIFTDVRAVLVSAGLFVTNSTTNATTGVSINSSYNDRTPSRPQIIIRPVGMDEANYKFGSNIGRRLINVTIECYYSGTLGIDQLSDGVANAMSQATWDGMDFVGVSMDYAFNTSADAKQHLKTLTYTFDRE